MEKEIIEFLRESNAIERVYDEDSLQQAKYAWDFLSAKKKMTTDVILKTHKILMLQQPLRPNERGYFRYCMVYIGGQAAIDASEISGEIKQWCLNVNDLINNGRKENRGFIEKTIRQHHVLYEKIHPFIDGNGRTGRMFMNWERIMLGLPIIIIHEGQEQLEYYRWFKQPN